MMNEKSLDRIVRSTLGIILLVIVLFLLASPTALIEGMILLVVGIPGVRLLSTGLLDWLALPQIRSGRTDGGVQRA
jgi:Inner membrane protein YgaP-like, transmembrane domain